MSRHNDIPDHSVSHVGRLDLTFAPRPWTFASRYRAEITRYFADLQRRKPEIWNGRVLLLYDHVFAGGVFRGQFLETDFASFTTWRAWDRPEEAAADCFAAAAIMTADNACLLGLMGDHTANAGAIYFPSGTPDPNDVVGDRIDFDYSVQRELREETGLDVSEFDAEPGWTMVRTGVVIAQVKVLRSSQPAEVLRARIMANLARERQPELCDILIVRKPGDVDSRMPAFVSLFLEHRWR